MDEILTFLHIFGGSLFSIVFCPFSYSISELTVSNPHL